MAEANPAAPAADPKPTDDKSKETPPAASSDKNVEPPKDESKVIPLDRFNEVNTKLSEATKQLKTFQDEKAAAEKKQLEEQGKWEELAKQNEAKANQAAEQVKQARIENRVIAEAAKLGVNDPSDALALLDKSKVTVEDDGTVSGVEEALKALVEAKPYLVAKDGTNRVGTGTNPANPAPSTTGGKIKLSDIQDVKYYREHEKEIMQALKDGNVIDDTK